MKGFLLGATVGYVLGAKAGRGRYEQIMRTYHRIADHPAVQGAAGIARAKVGEKVGERLPFGSGESKGAGANGQRQARAPR